MTEDTSKTTSFRDTISSMSKEGKRVWMYPKKQKGKWFNRRTLLSYFLLVLLVTIPFMRIGGEPVLLLNVLSRKFVIFGQVFWPQDFHLFAFAMITFVVFVILFTLVFGRLFCGWVCPQTIFMEMIFRKIEYWIEGDWQEQKLLTKSPWNGNKIIKRGGKWVVFYLLSFVIANVFLAYILGSEELTKIIIDDPHNHIGGLTAIFIFSFVFFFVYSYFREQVCTTICPYGRLQGVLLDKNSIIISYDYKRGENRAKIKKGEDRAASKKGDCIDCNQCVNVCPTGIDIRNGTQLECINCTACIDACNFMMEQVGLEKGLIRYDSDAGISSGKTFTITNKIKAYSVVLLLLIAVFFAIIFSRTEVETGIFRAQGMLYQKVGNDTISNLYNYKIINKTNENFPIQFKLMEHKGRIQIIGTSNLKVDKQSSIEGTMFIFLPKSEVSATKTKLKVGVYSLKKELEVVKTQFTGPIVRK